MTPRTRRVLQAVLYEVFAIAFVGPMLSFAFDKLATSTVGLAFVLSSIALGWNYVFNTHEKTMMPNRITTWIVVIETLTGLLPRCAAQILLRLS